MLPMSWGALHAAFLGEYEGHPNMGKYAAAGYDLVTL